MRKNMNELFGSHKAYEFFTDVRGAIGEAVYQANRAYAKARHRSVEEDVAYQYLEVNGWKRRELGRDVHPMVRDLLKQVGFPDDLNLLVLEFPHMPKDGDPSRVAYTQSFRKGLDDKQTVTSMGKYARRHWPQTPDHVLRNILAVAKTKVEITKDSDEMVALMGHNDMPNSCMSGSEDSYQIAHPYRMYDPAYGWGLAIGRDGSGRINSRAVVFEGEVGTKQYKCFVRTYTTRGDYQRSEPLDAALKAMGYEHAYGWPIGARLKYKENISSDFLCTYLDGDNHYIDIIHRDEVAVVTGSRGEYDTHDMDRDDGVFYVSNRCECADCGSRVSEDDTYYIDYHEHRVCTSCVNDHYRDAIYNHRGHTELVHEDNAVFCRTDDEYYTERYAAEVLVEVGYSWYRTDDENIVYCETDGEYYMVDDSDLVYIDDAGEWYRKDDDAVAQCQSDEKWYMTEHMEGDADFVQDSDGDWYHRDDSDIVYSPSLDAYFYYTHDDVVKTHEGDYAHRVDCVYLISTRDYMTIEQAQAELDLATQGE